MLSWRELIGVFTLFIRSVHLSDIRPPHIVFIIVDDVGWNDVGWHNPEIKTPNLNYLARSGVEINNSYVSPVCSPSRASLLTGRYPFKLGLQQGIIINDKPQGIPLRTKLLPQVLKEIGYSTHAVGKWHLGFCNWSYTPTDRGFDTFYGFYTGHQDHFDHSDTHGYDFRFNRTIHRTDEYSTTTYGKRVEDIVRLHDVDKPLFIYLAFQAAHPPLQVPVEYLKYYKFLSTSRRKLFSGMMTAMDETTGRIMKALDAKDMLKNTLFAFVSDNGASQENGGNNWPLKGSKATLWEGGVRVPSFISGIQLPSKKLQGLFHAVDWFPTLIEAASMNQPRETDWMTADIDGISHWDSLLSRHKTTRRQSFVYHINSANGEAALRKGRYKMVEGCAGYNNHRIAVPKNVTEENNLRKNLKKLRIVKKAFKNCTTSIRLFDLQEDEFEMHDLSNSPMHSKVFVQMSDELNKFKLQEIAPFNPTRMINALPIFWGGVWGPGWC